MGCVCASQRTVSAWAPANHGVAPKLFDELRSEARDTFYRIQETPILMLDDLGAERPTEWVLERLNILVDTRWREQRPILVTTNLEPGELWEQLGERAYSRLADGALAVAFGGGDRRRNK